MPFEEMIPAREFCIHHQIEISFLHSLHDFGLIVLDAADSDVRLRADEVARIERLVRLHYDLHINLEGIDAVENLLQQMETMRRELNALRYRLRHFEEQSVDGE